MSIQNNEVWNGGATAAGIFLHRSSDNAIVQGNHIFDMKVSCNRPASCLYARNFKPCAPCGGKKHAFEGTRGPRLLRGNSPALNQLLTSAVRCSPSTTPDHRQDAGLATLESFDIMFANNFIERCKYGVRLSLGAGDNSVISNTFQDLTR